MDKRDIYLSSSKQRSSTTSSSGEQDAPGERDLEAVIIEKIPEEGIALSELAKKVERESGLSGDVVIAKIIAMRSSTKIRLTEKIPFLSLGWYIISPYSVWFWIAAFSTIFSFDLISVSSGAVIYLRYVFGALLILFLPGFSLVELVYAGRGEHNDLTQLALSIILSLALVPLIGFVLNYTPFGVRLIPITLTLSVLTIVFLLLAIQKKYSHYKLAIGVG